MRVRLIEILCVVVTVAACSQPQRSFDPELVTLAISPVAVVDVEGGRSIPGQTVLLAGDSIVAIGPVHEIAIPPGADRLEAADGFLMPGFWDMHVHLANPAEPVLSPERQLEEYLRWGVVGVRDMGGDWSELLRLKAAVTEERSKGPRIVAAGPFLDDDGEEALFLRVAEAGQWSIEHLSPVLPSDAGLLFSCSSREDELRAELAAIQEERQREEVDREAIGQRRIRLQRDLLESFSGERIEAVANVLIGEGTWVTPTLVWSRTFLPTSRDVVPKDAPVEILPDEIAGRVGQERLDHNRWMADRTAEVVGALRAATLNAAEFRGEGGLEGQVRAGGKVDLVLVSDDPLVDIRATRRVRRVWRSGTLVFRR